MELKKCSRCKKHLPINQFMSKTGLIQSRCKACNSAYQSERRMIKSALNNPNLFRVCKTCGKHFNGAWGGRRKDGTFPLVKECKFCGSPKIAKASIKPYISKRSKKNV